MSNPERKESTAVATVREQREAFKEEIERFRPSIEKVIPKYLTADRMLSLTLLAATKTPALFECTPMSIAQAVMRVAQWGLDIGTTAHLVPFGTTCTPIADWKGLVEMALRSSRVRDIFAHVVYAHEHFVVTGGTNPGIEHHPIHGTDEDRGPVVAYYAVAILAGPRATFEVMSADDVERIRAAAVSKDSPAWKNHRREMGKKSVIRRLCKRLPQTRELTDALAAFDGEQTLDTPELDAPLPRRQLSRAESDRMEPHPLHGKKDVFHHTIDTEDHELVDGEWVDKRPAEYPSLGEEKGYDGKPMEEPTRMPPEMIAAAAKAPDVYGEPKPASAAVAAPPLQLTSEPAAAEQPGRFKKIQRLRELLKHPNISPSLKHMTEQKLKAGEFTDHQLDENLLIFEGYLRPKGGKVPVSMGTLPGGV